MMMAKIIWSNDGGPAAGIVIDLLSALQERTCTSRKDLLAAEDGYRESAKKARAWRHPTNVRGAR